MTQKETKKLHHSSEKLHPSSEKLQHSSYLALLDAAYRRRLRRKERGLLSHQRATVLKLMEYESELKDRHASRAEYERRRMEFHEQKSKRDQEKWELEKKGSEATLFRNNLDLLEKDLSKLTPRKKKFYKSHQNMLIGYDQDDPNSIPDYSSNASQTGGGDGSGGGDYGNYFSLLGDY
ncbi:unnamed protein product [Linum trigynum]|uniref:Uncharacterized protein n=1 Tax=Linum trigynum TaxID=586398 RepID=A0AAV2E4D6_9ROSI